MSVRLNPTPSPFGASTRAQPRDPKSLRSPFFSKLPSSTPLLCSTSTARVKWEIGVQKAWTSKVENSPEEHDESPVSVPLTPVSGEAQFDRVLGDAQQLQESVVFIWMASWCRKCIYLKPKLEKLAAEYYPRLRFYCVDVNAVPHRLVTRAGVTKMPTIQLWKDNKKQAEVIGGQKAHFVISEVQDMIENDSTIL